MRFTSVAVLSIAPLIISRADGTCLQDWRCANGGNATVSEDGSCACVCPDQWSGDYIETTRKPGCMECAANFDADTCDACADDFVDYPSCVHCATEVSCPEEGSPASNANHTTCLCSVCAAPWTGHACDECPARYSSADCSSCGPGRVGYPACELCANDRHCSGNAAAVGAAADQRSCVCRCAGQWKGAACESCPRIYEQSRCAGCASHLRGETYPACVACSVADDCSSHAASAEYSSQLGQCVCECRNHWSGPRCETCEEAFDASNDCTVPCDEDSADYTLCRASQCSLLRHCGGPARASRVRWVAEAGRCVCTCLHQWTGAGCASCGARYEGGGCSACAANRVNYPVCALCSTEEHCSGNAFAAAANAGQTECTCACRHHWTGASCSLCPQPYTGSSDCAGCSPGIAAPLIQYPSCTACSSATHCSGNGRVVGVSDFSECECACHDQWTGPHCDACDWDVYSGRCDACGANRVGYPECAACDAKTHCSNHADAAFPDDALASCVCNCTDHWVGAECEVCPSRFSSEHCDRCAPNRAQYPTCVECDESTHCNGRGVAVSLDGAVPAEASAFSACVCLACADQWQGRHCERCPPLYDEGKGCAACAGDAVGYPNCTRCTVERHCNGRAAAAAKAPEGDACRCACNGQWGGASCGTCPEWFAGENCDRCALGRVEYPQCRACSVASDCAHAEAVRSGYRLAAGPTGPGGESPPLPEPACLCTCSGFWAGPRCDECPASSHLEPATCGVSTLPSPANPFPRRAWYRFDVSLGGFAAELAPAALLGYAALLQKVRAASAAVDTRFATNQIAVENIAVYSACTIPQAKLTQGRGVEPVDLALPVVCTVGSPTEAEGLGFFAPDEFSSDALNRTSFPPAEGGGESCPTCAVSVLSGEVSVSLSEGARLAKTGDSGDGMVAPVLAAADGAAVAAAAAALAAEVAAQLSNPPVSEPRALLKSPRMVHHCLPGYASCSGRCVDRAEYCGFRGTVGYSQNGNCVCACVAGIAGSRCDRLSSGKMFDVVNWPAGDAVLYTESLSFAVQELVLRGVFNASWGCAGLSCVINAVRHPACALNSSHVVCGAREPSSIPVSSSMKSGINAVSVEFCPTSSQDAAGPLTCFATPSAQTDKPTENAPVAPSLSTCFVEAMVPVLSVNGVVLPNGGPPARLEAAAGVGVAWVIRFTAYCPQFGRADIVRSTVEVAVVGDSAGSPVFSVDEGGALGARRAGSPVSSNDGQGTADANTWTDAPVSSNNGQGTADVNAWTDSPVSSGGGQTADAKPWTDSPVLSVENAKRAGSSTLSADEPRTAKRSVSPAFLVEQVSVDAKHARPRGVQYGSGNLDDSTKARKRGEFLGTQTSTTQVLASLLRSGVYEGSVLINAEFLMGAQYTFSADFELTVTPNAPFVLAEETPSRKTSWQMAFAEYLVLDRWGNVNKDGALCSFWIERCAGASGEQNATAACQKASVPESFAAVDGRCFVRAQLNTEPSFGVTYNVVTLLGLSGFEARFALLERPCEEGSLKVSGSTECLPCPVGLECFGVDDTQVLAGWWRASQSVAPVECPIPDRCLGQKCSKGYSGVLCSSCDGSSRSVLGSHCLSCPSGEDGRYSHTLHVLCQLVLYLTLFIIVFIDDLPPSFIHIAFSGLHFVHLFPPLLLFAHPATPHFALLFYRSSLVSLPLPVACLFSEWYNTSRAVLLFVKIAETVLLTLAVTSAAYVGAGACWTRRVEISRRWAAVKAFCLPSVAKKPAFPPGDGSTFASLDAVEQSPHDFRDPTRPSDTRSDNANTSLNRSPSSVHLRALGEEPARLQQLADSSSPADANTATVKVPSPSDGPVRPEERADPISSPQTSVAGAEKGDIDDKHATSPPSLDDSQIDERHPGRAPPAEHETKQPGEDGKRTSSRWASAAAGSVSQHAAGGAGATASPEAADTEAGWKQLLQAAMLEVRQTSAGASAACAMVHFLAAPLSWELAERFSPCVAASGGGLAAKGGFARSAQVLDTDGHSACFGYSSIFAGVAVCTLVCGCIVLSGMLTKYQRINSWTRSDSCAAWYQSVIALRGVALSIFAARRWTPGCLWVFGSTAAALTVCQPYASLFPYFLDLLVSLSGLVLYAGASTADAAVVALVFGVCWLASAVVVVFVGESRVFAALRLSADDGPRPRRGTAVRSASLKDNCRDGYSAARVHSPMGDDGLGAAVGQPGEQGARKSSNRSRACKGELPLSRLISGSAAPSFFRASHSFALSGIRLGPDLLSGRAAPSSLADIAALAFQVCTRSVFLFQRSLSLRRSQREATKRISVAKKQLWTRHLERIT
ncbi:Laminin subunit alpha [Diplonema papillatum]|nr:Laminin subunit alpha [Diplonema papillatum]